MSLGPAVPRGAGRWAALRPALPWPPGTGLFFLKTWLALAIGFYAAFFFQLDGASSTGVCVLILAQPSRGLVLAKAFYRTLGTLGGVVAALALSALFPQDRTMLLAGFTVWMGVMTGIATLLRDFRAYACVLAGYTVGIVSLVNVDAPAATFSAAVNRVAAILVGVAAITLANILLGRNDASRGLGLKLRAGLRRLLAAADDTFERRQAGHPEDLVDVAAALAPLRGEIGTAGFERDGARNRAAGGRSALLGLYEAVTAVQAVGVGLARAGALPPPVEDAAAMARAALHRQDPDRVLPRFDALALQALRTGSLRLADAHLLDRLRHLVTTVADVRDGLRSLRTGRAPRRRAALPVHQDYVAAVLNAARVMIAVGVAAVLAVWSGIPQTSVAVLYTSVFVSLGSLLPDPRAMGNAGLFGMPAVAVLSAVYAFLVFPNIQGYALFIVSLAPLVLLMCALILAGQPGYGLIIGVQTLAQVAPANVQVLDPEGFVASATMLIPSGLAIFAGFALVLPVQPAQRRLRLALGVGRALRNALADRDKRPQPRASLHYDRLSQFKTWQRGAPATPARRRTMRRLVDLGFLAYAVRRSWRALDRAGPHVPAALDGRARAVLPTLTPDATELVAQAYLDRAAAEPDDAGALALVHAAAALHGTALVTGSEARLLRRVRLLGRTP